jgi:5-methylcytosine-specific restriction protein A
MSFFIPGQEYLRSDLHEKYGGSHQSGISSCPNFNMIMIFSGATGAQYGYNDSWSEDNTHFYYTGEGQTGDMTFKRGNKAILEHLRKGVELHLFQYINPGKVRYIDRMRCIGVQEQRGLDKDGIDRKIIIFELERYGEDPTIIEEDIIESDSWKVLSDTVAIKKMDRSSFFHQGTGIPIKIRDFFDLTAVSRGQKCSIELIYNNQVYRASIGADIQHNPRTRLIWHTDFETKIHTLLPHWHQHFSDYGEVQPSGPEMRFIKMENPFKYIVEFIEPEKISADIYSDINESSEERAAQEGRVIHYFGKRYERDSENRLRAIEIHGLECIVCGFNFSRYYGDRGQGFIEIHHVKPISTFDQETDVNPNTDLVPVCANCHRMIHRKKDNVLSVEEMKQITNSKT